MKKSLKIASAIAGGLILVIVTVFLIFAAMLLDKKPVTPQAPLTADDFEVQNRILGQIFRSITSRKAPEIAVLKLTPEEFQSLINCADRFVNIRGVPLREYRPALSDGEFLVTAPYNTGKNWLFGGWLIARFRLKITKDGEKLDVTALQASVGKFKLANETAQKIFDAQLQKICSGSDYERFNRIVESVSVDGEGNLIIRYRPRNAVFLLKRR